MKTKEFKELKSKSIEKLIAEADSKRLAVYKFKSEMKVGKEKNLKKGKNLKKDLSQILTVVREKEIEEKMNKNKKTEKEGGETK